MVYLFNGVRLDTDQRVLSREGGSVQLTPKTRDLLLVFLRNPGKALSRQELLDEVWPGVAVSYEALTFQISELRKALGGLGSLLRTVPRQGYMWQGEGLVEAPSALVEAPPIRPAGLSGTSRPRSRALFVILAAALASTALTWYALRSYRAPFDWVPVFSDDFERSEIGSAYRVVSGTWDLNYGGLRGRGSGAAHIDLDQRIEGCVRVEFDATILAGSGKKEIAIWLLAGHTDAPGGYYFGIGADHQVAEIDRNLVEITLSSAPALSTDRVYHISVTRTGNRLAIALDGVRLVAFNDPVALSPGATSTVRIGTFDGMVRIDNLRVYRERVPATVEPTVPADRIFERGDFDAAQAEYERVARDRSEEPVGGEALFKVGLCLLAKNQPADAVGAFRAVASSPATAFHKHLAALDEARALAEQGEVDTAYGQLQALAHRANDSQQRFGIANEMLQIAAQIAQLGQRARAAEVRRYVVDNFASLPILAERAASLVAIYGHEDADDHRPLESFLTVYRRPGKPRLAVERCLAMLHFMDGDADAAVKTFQAIEREYAQVNARFSLDGAFGRACVLAAGGRVEESARIAHAMPERLQHDNLPLRLLAEWELFSRWAQGDLQGAILALEREIAHPHGSTAQSRFDRIDLALLYAENGDRARAAELLTPLAQDDDQPGSKTASLLLGLIPPERYAADDAIEYDEQRLYLGRFYELNGRTADAVACYRSFDVREATSFSTALCRAYLYLNRHRGTLPPPSSVGVDLGAGRRGSADYAD